MNKKLIRKMLTASGGPIELYNTLWVDNWRNRLTSPVVVAKQLEKLTSKIPIKYLGGSKDNARKEFWKQEPVLQHAVDSVASLYRINPESLKYRLDKEGFTDRLIKRVNASVKQGTQRVHERGYKLLNDPNYGLAGTQIGLDDARTYIDSGKVKLINENWYEQGPFKNEKGRMTYPVNPVTLNDGIGIVAAHLKYFRDKALLDFPNASEYDLDRYANAYYNRGALGGKKWVLAGAKGYNYRKKGGMLEFLKNGSGIHIKEENKGKFTSYCGGKVTDECILKGKNSSNPAIRKRATFAANARKWKHKEGGSIEKLEKGSWISKGLNFLNESGLGKTLVEGGLSFLLNSSQNKSIAGATDVAKAELDKERLEAEQQALLMAKQKTLEMLLIDPNNPNAFGGTIFLNYILQLLYNEYLNYIKLNFANKKALLDMLSLLMLNENTSGTISGILLSGLGAVGNFLGGKKNNSSSVDVPSSTTITGTPSSSKLVITTKSGMSGTVDLWRKAMQV